MKEYVFIDLHIHTEYSNEDGCDLKVKKLLDTLQATAEHKNGEICFSITDHESILGAIEADKILRDNPEKYNRLTFIPGIELNASLKSVALNESGQSIFSKCHMLGYGYDLKDKNLFAYSKLSNKVFKKFNGKNVNSGKQLLYAKKIVEKEFGVNIPFKTYLKCGYASSHRQMRNDFVYLTNKYLKVSKDKISDLIENAYNEKLIYKPEADGGSKQDIFEIISLIKSAGGKTSIAHANSIKFEQQHIVHSKSKYDYLDDFIKIVQLKSKNGLDAIELFHSENTADDVFNKLYNIAEKYDMFLTCGSDHHGEHLHVNSLLSKCFSKRFEFVSVKPENREKYRAVVKNVITKIAFVDNICGKKFTYKSKRDFVCKNVEKGEMGYEGTSEIIDSISKINKIEFKEFYKIPTTVIERAFAPYSLELSSKCAKEYKPLDIEPFEEKKASAVKETVEEKKYSEKKSLESGLKNEKINEKNNIQPRSLVIKSDYKEKEIEL